MSERMITVSMHMALAAALKRQGGEIKALRRPLIARGLAQKIGDRTVLAHPGIEAVELAPLDPKCKPAWMPETVFVFYLRNRRCPGIES